MAISTDPNDPHFGLETDISSPDFGLPPQQPNQEGGVLSGIAAGIGRALNPINLIKGALDIGHPSDISNIIHYGKTLGEIVSGVSPDEAIGKNIPELEQQRKAVFGEYGTREQAAQLTGIGLQAGLLAAPFIHGKLGELAFGKSPEVTAETPVTDTVVETPKPTIPEPTLSEERFPSLLQSDENLRRGELQQQLNKERGFELVPEPPPEIAPAPTLEQTLETAQVPEPRVSPETGFEFPNEPIETRTNIPSETAAIGGEQNASEITVPESVPVPEVRESVGGETPLRQQGETPVTREEVQPETVPQAGQVVPEAEPQPPAATVPEGTPEGGVNAAALEERPINAPEPGEHIGWQETRDFGNEWLDKGGNINKVMADFRRTGKLDPWDVGKGAAYLERLQADTNRVADALRENPNDPTLQQQYGASLQREQRFSDDFKPMATSASNQLKGFQGKVPLTDDMADSFSGLVRKYGEIQGKQVTPEEAVKADRIAKQNAKAKADYGTANDELYKKIDTEYGRIRTIRKAPPTLEDLGKTFGQTLKEVCEV